ncbi:threonine-phosphate decarboxylase CobD [Nitrospirillum sp. BR 11828]|uniref:threonine-phosphate decarboxylase CobD n=1 Tax=Nitrospirillum sp. BR 11828 TaxID=3104325 RepID=UPI002ACB0193|nr:threonine-phosphate decarboxylase CobD [Nitrospirillum sp. BR 11828]MDZ5650557.1 threonine-phosphate decarboxylase CobD [Nitrospirillum sp. BR 11828]
MNDAAAPQGREGIRREGIRHGGDLTQAARLFPEAPAPWIDLSTGINPWPYPLPALAPAAWTALPTRGALDALLAAAAGAYGAPGPDSLVAAPGSELLIQTLPRLRPPGEVAIVGPTYGDHARAWAAGGHRVQGVATPDGAPGTTDVLVVCNPNNPDGRTWSPTDLLDRAADLAARGGWLVVDEAYADLDPGRSLCGHAGRPGLIILRSFGKFFGLGGLRLGFILAPAPLLDAVRAGLGSWAVSGPALAVGTAALADLEWQAGARRRLAGAADALDAVVRGAGVPIVGGTALYRLLDAGDARHLWRHLAQCGVWTRPFPEHPGREGWLRLGLPPDPDAMDRLAGALASFVRP